MENLESGFEHLLGDFTPDEINHVKNYEKRLRIILQNMVRDLAGGKSRSRVALSEREIEEQTGATKSGEEFLFTPAWELFRGRFESAQYEHPKTGEVVTKYLPKAF
jgi:hypothetical protein